MMETADHIYQLKVSLQRMPKPVWRRIKVKGSATLYRLHNIIQEAMGWQNYHLYRFEVNGEEYGDSLPDLPMRSARRHHLQDLMLQPGDRFLYEYDFGDSWMHKIQVESIHEPEPGVKYPVCTAGKRACPPEDCGGAWGYKDLVEAIADPAHPEHESYLEWLGGPFDPEAFDLSAANEQFKQVRSR